MNKRQMIEYLRGHFRYWTANSWNQSKSYAARMKINDFVPHDLRDKAFEILEQGGVFEDINVEIAEFDREHGYAWQAGFNGRSGGYLVLYQGGKHEDGGVFSRPGRGTDDEAGDFEDWDADSLRERVRLVKEFDKLAKRLKDIFLDYCRSYTVEEKVITVPKTIKVLKAR